ncbi:hypothetical protein GE061_010180 [Apolygus lucorum]|uniref:Uncharacterized protein n=1 Tax=Apolygus lucorum TaxID=248454 RepID=A0A8S9Y2H8_APOLU|nr:hypothetical protein GE061_010180 [Apolygus lucorum]
MYWKSEVQYQKVGAHPVHLLKKQVALLIIVFCGCMWVLLQIDFSRTATIFKFDKYGKTDYSSSGFLIDTKGCRILDLDPFDPSLVQYFGDEDPIDCNPSQLGGLVKSDVTKSELYVDQMVVRNYTNSFFTCCYKPFKRKEVSRDAKIERRDLTYPSDVDEQIDYSEFCNEFTDNVVIEHEFVKVTCTEGSKEIYKEFFAFAKNPYQQGDPEYRNGVNSDKLSVLMIGFDGMSRLNFLRQMPRTIDFLEKRDAISLLGYNKVGYNTFPNLLPILTGYSEANLLKVCWPTKHSVFDNCTFIWDLFKKKGYVTSYGEDTPNMGTFYYPQKGIQEETSRLLPQTIKPES